jgi:hypothetical protein
MPVGVMVVLGDLFWWAVGEAMVTTMMSTAALALPDGGLAAWAAGVARRSAGVVAQGLRFAF